MISISRLGRTIAVVGLLAATAGGPAQPAVATVGDCMPTWAVVVQSGPPLHGVDAVSSADVWVVGVGVTEPLGGGCCLRMNSSQLGSPYLVRRSWMNCRASLIESKLSEPDRTESWPTGSRSST